MDDERQSIFSHGEREIASMLREGHTIEGIADERDDSPDAVEKAVSRIREKTDRALATLLQSPDTEAAVAALDPADRAELRARIDDAD